MKNIFVLASLFVASPCLADPVLVAPEQPSPWPITMRLERPHSDEAPACGALAAIERWAPEEPRGTDENSPCHRGGDRDFNLGLDEPAHRTETMISQNPRDKLHDAHGRLFQAAMWREYAMAWDGKSARAGIGHEWMEKVSRISRTECLRRARVNVYLAHRLNRRKP